jgi:hypothetical protein
MFDNDVKQGCPLSLALFTLYIDELETCLDNIDGDLCVYLTQWLAFSFMMTMFFCSLNHEHASKE